MKQARVTLLSICASLLVLLLLPSMTYNYVDSLTSRAAELTYLQPLLAGNKTVGVSVYNLHYKCPDAKLLDLMKQSMQQGNSWEIIGFSEMTHSAKKCFATDVFIEEAKKAGLTYYCRRQNSANLDDINAVICSKYPLNESSYAEIAIHPYGPRVMQCIEVLVPDNPVIVCNTHVKTKGDSLGQLRIGIDFILNKVSSDLIPPTITDAADREMYKKANLARTMVIGDFNAGSKGAYPFVGTCKERREKDCFFGSWDVDHITLPDMNHPSINAQPPLNQAFLQALSFKRDVSLPWPTDHIGPVLAEINIKKLDVPIKSQKPGDLDANSVVDIFDYNLLLGKFGATGAAGFHAADIIQNGVVDIFDYNKLIEEFGK